MLAMRDWVEKHGFSVDVLAYDGMMARKSTEHPLADNHLQDSEQHIKDVRGYAISLANKPFEFFEIPSCLLEEVAPRVTKEEFVARKAQFEQDHFYMPEFESDRIVEVGKGGQLLIISHQHSATYLSSWAFVPSPKNKLDRVAWVNLWLKNEPRKIRLADLARTE